MAKMIFNEKRMASEYEKRLSSEGYPGQLLDIIKSEISIYSTVIDIGAGTGFFTIPLAKAGYSLTAIEPSPEMIKIMRSKITKGIFEKIRISNNSWEKWDGQNAEIILSIHSIYPMPDAEEAIRKMMKYADRVILLIKKGLDQMTLTSLLRDNLGCSKRSSVTGGSIRSILDANHINYTVREIIQERKSVFCDPDSEAEYYRYLLRAETEKFTEIRKFIVATANKIGDFYEYKSVYRDELFVLSGYR